MATGFKLSIGIASGNSKPAGSRVLRESEQKNKKEKRYQQKERRRVGEMRKSELRYRDRNWQKLERRDLKRSNSFDLIGRRSSLSSNFSTVSRSELSGTSKLLDGPGAWIRFRCF
jgi:hypothetical protein